VIRIVIHGAGRMGEAIATVAGDRPDIEVTAIVSIEAPSWTSDIPYFSTLAKLPAKPDLLIDFTLPAGTAAAAEWCAENGIALLSGVTGLGGQELEALQGVAVRAPVLWSPNLSIGVNLLADLAGRASAVLDAATPVSVEDIHHQWKKDAPSGTALMLGEAVTRSRGGDPQDIEYSSVREGEHVGIHTVTFRLSGEEVSLIHHAHDRSIYARGALAGGLWLVNQPPGLYTAADWLNGQSAH
jgi:4-hydroxy-tetrahydrodipicolinate reductase